jgi:hypothetical protein
MSAAVAATEFRRKAMRAVGMVTAFVLVIGSSGCVPGYVRENESPVLFRITSISPTVIASNVGTPAADLVSVSVAVRPKNPLNNVVPQIAEAVFVEQYRVRFLRTDGRDVEGVDVPFSFSGALTQVIDIATAGSTALSIPLVRAQAKQEAPLRNLRSLVAVIPGPNGGILNPTVTMTAEITIFGRTTAGEAVSDTARVTVDFVDLSVDLT